MYPRNIFHQPACPWNFRDPISRNPKSYTNLELVHEVASEFDQIYPPQNSHTPQKFNMEPENNGFQKDFPFPGTYFQVPY